MTGNLLREKCSYDFGVKEKDLDRTVEALINTEPDQRSMKQVLSLVHVV